MARLLKIFVIACLLIVFSSSNCFAQSNTNLHPSILDDPDYANPLPMLKKLVKEKVAAQRNTFYIAKVRNSDESGSNENNYSVYVYWRERNALILWEA